MEATEILQEKELLAPQLRFKEFDGEWKGQRLKDMTILITKGTTPLSFSNEGINYIKIEGLVGIKINKEKCLYIDKDTHNKELRRSILQKNDILFAIAGATIGKVAFVTEDILPANTNQALAIIRLKNVENLQYTIQILQSRVMKKYIKESISVGAQPNLNLEQMGDFRFNIPSLPEQQKIACFLSLVDEKIQKHTRKKELLEQYKKGVMQQLFSQKLRFKDENGKDYPEWEEKIIEDLCEYRNGGSFESLVSEEGLYNLISLNSIDINGKLKSEHKKVSKTDNSLIKGDLVMVLSDVAHGFLLGLTDIIPGDNYVLNQRMGALKPRIELDRYYLKSFINYNQNYFKLMGQGSSQKNLSKGEILSFKVKFPIIKEQQKIADFLSNIDKKIENVTSQITHTQTFKKGLLQQMFV